MYFLVLVFAVIAGSWALPQAPQEPSEYQALASEKGTRYHVYGQATYFMALEICALNGQRLVRIDQKSKSDEVTYFVDKSTAIVGPYWTLPNRLNDDTTWGFGVGDPVKFFNWAAGEPNNAGGNERCVELYKNGEWNDKDCSTQNYVLCESNADKSCILC